MWKPIAIGAAILVPLYLYFREPALPDAPTAEQVGLQASKASMFVVKAADKCNEIGFEDIRQCASSEGTLLEDQLAQVIAKMAIESTEEYMASCKLAFTLEYCNAVIDRAYTIQLRRLDKRHGS